MCASVSEAEEAATRMGGSAGCDVTVDAIGSCEVVEAAVKCLKRMGRSSWELTVVFFAMKQYENALLNNTMIPRCRHVQIGLLPPAVVQGRASVPMHYVIGR